MFEIVPLVVVACALALHVHTTALITIVFQILYRLMNQIRKSQASTINELEIINMKCERILKSWVVSIRNAIGCGTEKILNSHKIESASDGTNFTSWRPSGPVSMARAWYDIASRAESLEILSFYSNPYTSGAHLLETVLPVEPVDIYLLVLRMRTKNRQDNTIVQMTD